MNQKVVEFIDKYDMIKKGDKIIVAVSGGPDSICLLHMLYEMKKQYSIQLIVAHVNHGLRGEEADADQEYVRQFCEKLQIEYYVKNIDINKLSEQRGISTEMAGREARYEFFDYLYKKLHAQKIALAHNANDSVETVLMRIIRGTGSEGLIGIKPVRDEKYVRPILCLSREEIENYCEINRLKPRIDKTNLESIYSRNKVRLELIPYIKKNFNPNVIETINNLSQMMLLDNEYLEHISEEKFNKFCNISKGKVIIQKEMFSEKEAILSRVIRKSIECIQGDIYNFEKVHIFDIISLSKQGTGKSISLPREIKAYNNYGNIEISKTENKSSDVGFEYQIEMDSTLHIREINKKVTARVINYNKNQSFDENTNVRYFDFDKVSLPIYIRNRRQGDRFTPFGMKGSKKLKDFLIDNKVSKQYRDSIPLILFGNEIAWVVGYRISEKFRINKNTKKLLQIIIEGED